MELRPNKEASQARHDRIISLITDTLAETEPQHEILKEVLERLMTDAGVERAERLLEVPEI